jgi:hypothetical protein
MLDVEPVIRDELERLGADGTPAPDWADVLARTQVEAPRGRRRAPLLVAAAALGLVVVAVALAASYGGFRTWLTGEPGTPASQSAKSAFARATRSWQGFPRSTQLRQLVTADVAGVHYELDGFRGAGSLCLRAVVTGGASASRLACAPLSELRSTKAPALVLAVDSAVGKTHARVTDGPMTLSRPTAAISFGVLADDVTDVSIVHRRHTPTRVFVSGDAFLAVSPGLSPFDPTAKIVASAGAAHASVPFVHSSAPLSPPPSVVLPKPAGPTGTQTIVHTGSIRWFARRRPRGVAVPPGAARIGAAGKAIFARMIAPDPSQPERMVVSLRPAGTRYFGGRLHDNRAMCAELVGGRYQGGGCRPAGRLFSTGPFTLDVTVQRGGQVAVVSGLAADGVASLEEFPAVGRPRRVTSHDNGYFFAATIGDFPIRLVAYDARGRIIGNTTFAGLVPAAPFRIVSPAPGAHWKRVLVNRAGSVYEIPSTTGGTCAAFKIGGGVGTSCDQTVSADGLTVSVGSDSHHGFVEGIAGSRVREVRVTLANGRQTLVRPVRRYLLLRLAHPALHDRAYRVTRIDGLDANGRVVVRRRFG